MKIIFGLFLIALSTYFGYYLSIKYKTKKDFYIAFYDFNKKLKNEVLFTKKTIYEIIDKPLNNDFYELLKNRLSDNSFISDKLKLTDDELDFFYDYADRIGQTETKTEIDYLSSIETVLKDKMNNAINEEKKYKTLFIKMGFLIGLILFVLIL